MFWTPLKKIVCGLLVVAVLLAVVLVIVVVLVADDDGNVEELEFKRFGNYLLVT